VFPADEPKKATPPTITDATDDPAVWGQTFPLHYELYKKSADMTRTKHGGSEAMPRTPTSADPRSKVAQSKVEEDAGLKAIWQGYAFAADFREERGHAFMLEDQKYTQGQVVAKQPGTCLNCHASLYVAYKKAGDGDIVKGFEKVNSLPYADAEKLVKQPIACIDCHDSATFALRVTAPHSSRACERSRPRRASRTTT
jgi:nitrite reductase (cytochrome c-552)